MSIPEDQIKRGRDYIRAHYGSPGSAQSLDLSPAEAATVERFEVGEPAPESWRGDGLREALAEAIWVNMPDEPYREDADIAADAVLARPELAALRAKADAADRVRSLIAEHQAAHVNTVWLDRLRRALDGDGPC